MLLAVSRLLSPALSNGTWSSLAGAIPNSSRKRAFFPQPLLLFYEKSRFIRQSFAF